MECFRSTIEWNRVMIFWIPVNEYILEFESLDNISFPELPGSAFRGVFGICLRAECCIAKGQECHRCQLLRVCPYNIIFERAIPADGDNVIRDDTAKPYIFETVNLSRQFARKGELFSIRVKLFGADPAYTKYIIKAMGAAGRRGVNANRKRFRLTRVARASCNGIFTVYRYMDSHQLDIRDCHLRIECPDTASEIQVIIPENMPIILKARNSEHGSKRGVAISPEDFTARKFLTTAIRRTLCLYDHYGRKKDPSGKGLLPFSTLPENELTDLAYGIELTDAVLLPKTCTRYSNRSREKTSLQGFYGHFTLKGDLTPFIPYLWFCAVCHLGSYSIMGLGGFGVRRIR